MSSYRYRRLDKLAIVKDQDGQEVVLIPVRGTYQPVAKVLVRDFLSLLRRFVPLNWFTHGGQGARVYCPFGSQQTAVSADLLVAQPAGNQIVENIDGDFLNLRSDNLRLRPTTRSRADLQTQALIRAELRRAFKQPLVQLYPDCKRRATYACDSPEFDPPILTGEAMMAQSRSS